MNFLEAVKKCDKGEWIKLIDEDGEEIIVYKSINEEKEIIYYNCDIDIEGFLYSMEDVKTLQKLIEEKFAKMLE